MPTDLTPEFEQRLERAYIIWLTTVRADGMPQPTPVWFIRDQGTFLIYSQPTAQKLRNIRHNPKVALHLDTDAEGESYLVIMGEAAIDDSTAPSNQMAAYVEKYRQQIESIGYTPETLASTWSVAIRIRPLQIHGQ